MASPTLSRSSSTIFAPGPHRRSHPNLQNLQHLSLAPLTPKYPVDPADYFPYQDPNTSELHTSTSLSQIASLPSPGGILTNSPVRSRASSRKRKPKSSVKIQEPGHELGAQTSVPELSLPSHKPAAKQKKSKSHISLSRIQTDPEWLIQTGLSLTEGFRESKGQSWLAKRDSSTSFAATPAPIDESRRSFPLTPHSGRTTPAARSRIGSRASSRVPSRNASTTRLNKSMLSMTANTTATSFATAPEPLDDYILEEIENVEPEWADESTRAEAAAQSYADRFTTYNFVDDDEDDDPYGMLDFGDQGDTEEDEEEVKRAMARYGIRGLGWMDGAIDALLKIEEDVNPVEVDEEDPYEEVKRFRKDSLAGEGIDVEAPPSDPQSYLETMYWFGRLVRRAAAG